MPWRDLSSPQLLDRMPLAALVTRLDGRIEYANPEACALLAADNAASLSGRDVTEFRWGAQFLRVLAGAAARRNGFKQWQDEARYRSLRGHELWVLETMVPVNEASGEVACFLHFLQPLR
jgi:PAS domain S-box-containing protein